MPGECAILCCCCPWVIAGVAGGAAGWLLLAVAGHLAERPGISPRPDLSTGLAALLVLVYLRVFHRMKVEGRENLAAAVEMMRGARGGTGGREGREGAGEREGTGGRGVIVTVNHAAGIDPLLVQIAVGGWRDGFFIRWLAAADTVAQTVRPFVEFAGVIFLHGSGGGGSGGGAGSGGGGGEMAGVREVVRHVKAGGAVGIFPEGRIARRAGVITPFQPGVGLIVSRSGGIVLPVVLRGVPIRDNTYKSFFVPSRSTVVFMPPVDFSGAKAGAIVADLQGRYSQWVGPVVTPKGREPK